MKLSKNFTLKEFTRSQTATRHGIDNTPNAEEIEKLKALAENVLQQVRDKWGMVSISSGYRGKLLNRKIGSSDTSQHRKGEAADFEVPGFDNFALAEWIRDNCDFDQLILEGYDGTDANAGWIHCSYKSKEENRKSTLTATFVNGTARYTPGIG